MSIQEKNQAPKDGKMITDQKEEKIMNKEYFIHTHCNAFTERDSGHKWILTEKYLEAVHMGEDIPLSQITSVQLVDSCSNIMRNVDRAMNRPADGKGMLSEYTYSWGEMTVNMAVLGPIFLICLFLSLGSLCRAFSSDVSIVEKPLWIFFGIAVALVGLVIIKPMIARGKELIQSQDGKAIIINLNSGKKLYSRGLACDRDVVTQLYRDLKAVINDR